MVPDPSARDELLAIARGVRAETRRRSWRGHRERPALEDTVVPRGADEDATPARTAGDVRTQAKACRDLGSLKRAVSRCEACELAKTRTQTVFMDGKGARRLMFVGEAPGADEDRTGVPFVGRAGQLLTEIITKGMKIAREEVHIANVVKCRPPGNRDPTTEEKQTCTPWLDRQIELTNPAVIVPLGKHAANYLLGLPPETPIGKSRGRIHERGGRKLLPTFHPAYLLRSPGEKKECWKDIKVLMGEIGLTPPVPPGSPRRAEATGNPASAPG